MPVADRCEARGTTRRTLVVGSLYAMWAAIVSALGLPAFLYLFSPPKNTKSRQWVEAGDVAALTPGTPVELVFRRPRVDGWRVSIEKGTAWVLKQADGGVVAYGPQCTHLGCAYHWDDGTRQFNCPCHASLFGIDGRVMGGPAPRPLDRYEVRVESGKLLLGSLHRVGEPRS